jgi:DNA repair exonuclease SbcCD ATPase subunit
MANELIVLGENELVDAATLRINEKDLPSVLQGQVETLNELSKSLEKALRAADKATNSAKNAKNKSAGLFKNKAAIEELQSAGVDVADAIASAAEAQKISFEFQTKLAEISKYLIALGCINIVNNKTVIRQLESKLKNASKEELSELARQELMNVIRQLKAQEDILSKQEAHAEIAKEHDKKLKVLSQKDREIDEQLKTQLAKVSNHDKKVKALSRKDKEHDEQLKDLLEIEKRNDKELCKKAKKDKEQDALLESLQEVSHEMSKYIKAQKMEIERLNDKIENLHPLLTSKVGRFFPLVSFILSVIAIAGAVALIFIK